MCYEALYYGVYFSNSSLLAFPFDNTRLPIALQIHHALMLPAFIHDAFFLKSNLPCFLPLPLKTPLT